LVTVAFYAGKSKEKLLLHALAVTAMLVLRFTSSSSI